MIRLRWLLLFVLSSLASAQFTTVTGTVIDPNSVAYSNGTIVAVLNVSGSPTLNGFPYQPPTQPVGLNAAGVFLMQLADNTVLLPGGSTWTFTVCSAGGTVQPAGGTGPVCFTVPSLVIAGASQDISVQLQAAALALTNGGGGSLSGMVAGQIPVAATAKTVTSSKPLTGAGSNIMTVTPANLGPVGATECSDGAGSVTFSGCNSLLALPQSGLIADYQMPASEVSTTTLFDFSGNGNNGTFPGGAANPTRLAAGGLAFNAASAQIVALPNALNACVSWLFSYQWTIPNTTGYINFMVAQAALQGAGTVFGYGFATVQGAYTASQQFQQATTDIGDYSGGDGATQVINSGQGTHVLIFTSGVAQIDHIYSDNQESTMFFHGPSTTSSGARFSNATHWNLGGTASAFSGQNSYYNGNLYRAACWNRQLAPSEVAQANSVATTAMQQKLNLNVPQAGVNTVPSSWTGPDILVISGDSIATGAGDVNAGIPAWQTLLKLNTTNVPNYFMWTTAATGSRVWRDQAPNAFADKNFFNVWSAKNFAFNMGGRNDGSQDTYQSLQAAWAAYCRTEKTFPGVKCGLATTESDGLGAGSLGRIANAALRQNWQNMGADLFVDYGGDPLIGCITCTATMVGGIHPNIWTSAITLQYQLQRAINRLYGPQDFSSAPTYSSILGAATAITAATDGAQISTTGMSTATYTFASNPFATMGPQANGLGVLVTITGVTPAGYNTTCLTATSTATQITCIIPTFGLGAGSIFGTASAPMVEDKYAILNVGAATVPIGTACDYTGQYIYLKNVNAGTTTLATSSMPTEAAETFDGASTLAIAQNQTRILQAVTTSLPDTPQCGWRVIQ